MHRPAPSHVPSRDLSHLETDFLSAVAGGIFFAEEFARRFSEFSLSFGSISASPEMLGAMHASVSNIAAIASSLSDVETIADDIAADLQSDIVNIFQTLSIGAKSEDSNIADATISTSPTSSRSSKKLTPSKPTLSHSKPTHTQHTDLQSWLLQNIHYPFLSRSLKSRFAERLGVKSKAIDDWFTNARRKIGWSAFSKRYFQGDRSLTLDCAHRVFIEGSGHGAYGKEIIRDMEEIKATAERLYGGVQCDGAKPSSFAKELEGIDAQPLTSSQSRQRRLSTCSTISEQSTASYSSFSSGFTRKRSRDSSEESDATSLSEGSDTRSFRPLKRGRSVSSSLSSLSRESSFTTCSSESNDSSPELITPVSSPTHSRFSLELFDGWIDGISAEPAFLPHDLADKPPKSVLSHKRSLSDSDSDAPSKRARLERRKAAPVEKRKAPIPVPQPSDAATQPEPTAPSSSPSPPQVAAALPSTDDALSGQSVDEHVEEAVNQFVSQLDFTIPQAPVPAWETSLLGISLEATLFDFSSFETEAGSSADLPDDLNALLASISVPDAPLSTSEEALAEHYAPQHNAQQEGANRPKDAPLPPNTSAPAGSTAEDPSASPQSTDSIPVSLSSLDFDFLESLGAAPQSRLLDAHTASEDDTEAPATLVDVSSSLESDRLELDDPERAKKLERIDQLLAEAQRLQQEVFG